MPNRPGRPPGSYTPQQFTAFKPFSGHSVWVPTEGDDPGEVAAAYAQQQLVAAIRRQAGKAISAADVAEKLGRHRRDRTTLNVWTGRSAISLPMFLDLALAFGVNPFSHLDERDLQSLLPEQYRAWLGGWEPGDGKPNFRPPEEPGWQNSAMRLSAWLDEEEAAGSLWLVNEQVAKHETVRALDHAGLPPALIADQSTDDLVLSYEIADLLDVVVLYLPDTPHISRQRLLDTVGLLTRLADRPESRLVALFLLAPRSAQRLDALIPGLRTPQQGESIRIPPATLDRAAAAQTGSLPPEFELTTLATARARNGYLASIYEIQKTGH